MCVRTQLGGSGGPSPSHSRVTSLLRGHRVSPVNGVTETTERRGHSSGNQERILVEYRQKESSVLFHKSEKYFVSKSRYKNLVQGRLDVNSQLLGESPVTNSDHTRIPETNHDQHKVVKKSRVPQHAMTRLSRTDGPRTDGPDQTLGEYLS